MDLPSVYVQLPLFAAEAYCSCCHLSLPLDQFHHYTKAATDCQPACKACMRAYRLKRHPPKGPRPLPVDEKRCSTCHLLMPLANFARNRRARDGLCCRCKTCQQHHYQTHRATLALKGKERYERGRPEREARAAARQAERQERLALMASQTEKACTRCLAIKPLVSFARRKYGLDGLASQCKACAVAQSNEYVRTHRELVLIYKRLYYLAHREEHAQSARAWYLANREKVRSYQRAWCAAHPDWVVLYRKRSITRDPARHRLVRKAILQRRRARALLAEGSFTAQDLQCLYESQDGCCAYCGCDISVAYHVDHMTPLSRGGSNWPTNLCLSCSSCNHRKGVRTADEYRRRLAAADPTRSRD